MVDRKLAYNPDTAIHPGDSLKEELDFLHITQTELAKRTGLSEKHISQIINGEGPITPETAIKLERALGTPAAFWNNLQKNFELNTARIEAEEKLQKEVSFAKNFKCYPELVDLGCVKQTNDWRMRAEGLLNFFAVDSLSYIHKTEELAFLRQSSSASTLDHYSLAAWLRCGELESKEIKTEKYNEKRVKEIIPKLKQLTKNPEGFGKEIKNLCAYAGIAVVYTPYFKNTKVNGSARWIGDRPLIQLNTRGTYADIFWFTLFHEIGHILMHGVKDEFVEYGGKIRSPKEEEADLFAQRTLLSDEEYATLKKNRPITKTQVVALAKTLDIGPSIILGRLAHDKIANWYQIAKDRQRIEVKGN